jgi:hypothetical protein
MPPNVRTDTCSLTLFEAAVANLNPCTEVKTDARNPGRGPLLMFHAEH